MINIAAVHPDIIALERLRLGQPRLNSEWLELINTGSRPINVSQYYVVNGRGDGFTISLPRRKSLVIGPYQSLLIFSGHPDTPDDPALCYLSTQEARLFLRRKAYFWNPTVEKVFLYSSREAYLENPDGYLDYYRYERRSARAVVK